MAPSEKKEMGKVYREFSRQKYNKYKHQFPKMRESEIVSKIINEWDSLSFDAKEKLQKQYEYNRFIIREVVSESQSMNQSPFMGKDNPEGDNKQQKTVYVQTPTVKQSQKYQSHEEDIKTKQNETPNNDKPLEFSPQMGYDALSQPKKTRKERNKDYVQFFSYYYEKYSREHPSWKAHQISLIIKLLWRRRKNRSKATLKKKKISKKKEISGKRFYRKAKGLTSQDSNMQWRRMPFETRKLWQDQAKGVKSNADKVTKVVLKSTAVGCKIFDLFQKRID